MILNPAVLLLDEPLSALDPEFHGEAKNLLKRIHQDMGMTIVMVSHNFGDVMYLANRGAVINQGKIRIKGSDAVIETSVAPEIDRGYMGIRPEDILLLSPGADYTGNPDNRFCGTITRVASQGIFVEVHVESGTLKFEAVWPRRYIRDFQITPGREVTIAFSPKSVHVFQEQPQAELVYRP